ncbi:MAG: Crp/Fnr family transcriptional regulator [Hyphomicrobiaceae bacterium]
MLGPNTCERCAVRNRALCGALTSEELRRINSIAYRRRFQAGDVILGDSEAPEFFANIIAGVVKLSKMIPDGRQQIVGLQFPSDFIGRPFAARNPFFAEAASDVELCCYPKRRFEDMVRELPELEHRMFQHTLDELDAARQWMVLLGRKSAEERIASFLMLIASRTSRLSCTPTSLTTIEIELPLTRAEIADYLGLTIETVSRQFSKLKSRKLIQIGHGRLVVIPSVDDMLAASGGDLDLIFEGAATRAGEPQRMGCTSHGARQAAVG